jgi:hypothetical protein
MRDLRDFTADGEIEVNDRTEQLWRLTGKQ